MFAGEERKGHNVHERKVFKHFDPTITLLCMSWDCVVTRTFMKWQTVELKIITLCTEIHFLVNNGTEVSYYANIKWMIQNI